MKITIDEDVCKKNKIELDEMFIIALVKLGTNIQETIDSMIKKGLIVRADNCSDEFLVTQRWNDVFETTALDSEKDTQPADRIDSLIVKMQELFPKGKKEGTNQYWRGNKREISLRVKKFFKLYGNFYTDDQILDATKSYVEGFNSRYTYMRVLKYFIWKDEKKLHEDGETKVVEVSELANYIENADQIDTLKEEWTSTLN